MKLLLSKHSIVGTVCIQGKMNYNARLCVQIVFHRLSEIEVQAMYYFHLVANSVIKTFYTPGASSVIKAVSARLRKVTSFKFFENNERHCNGRVGLG